MAIGREAVPAAYHWLFDIGVLPKMLTAAIAWYGLHEGVGSADNPTILEWAKEFKISNVYQHDSTAWCGLFLLRVCADSGKTVGFSNMDALWALNWAKFGIASDAPKLGDVMVFKRFDDRGRLIGGHVGLNCGESADTYHVLGGNTSDQVKIAEIAKGRFLAARHPIYELAAPATRRVFHLTSSGQLSTNEA